MATNPSIVDFLNKQGKSSSFASRAKLAAQYGIANYTGAADQNTKLLGILSGQQSTDSPKYSSADASSVSQPSSTYNPDLTINKVTTSVTTRQLSDGTVERLDPITGRRIALYSSPQEESAAIKKEVAAQEAERDARKLPPAPTPMPTSMSLDPTPQQTGDSGQTLLTVLEQFIQGLQGSGLMLNPNVQITPEKILEFTQQASQEINPYFADQLKIHTDQFQREMGLAPQQYERSLRDIGSSAAEQGMALSGRRQEKERLLTEGTQFQAGTQARQFAQQFGTSNLPTAPTLNAPDRQLPLYTLSDNVYKGLTGTEQFNERAAIKSRTSELESAFRQGQAVPTPRTISL